MRKAKPRLPPFRPFAGWSDSKLHTWERCPLQAQLKHSLHLCAHCFRGEVPYGDGALCTACHRPKTKPPAMQRGVDVDEAISAYLTGSAPLRRVHEAINPHASVPAMLRDVRGTVKRVKARVQFQVVLNRLWRLIHPRTPDAWFRGKLDVLVYIPPHLKVIDWKTGGIDKRTHTVRESPEYDDQMAIYSLAALCAEPTFTSASSVLVFLDAPAGAYPVRDGREIKRREVDREKRRWELRVLPMLTDTVFAPRPGWYCDYCEFSKNVGGPCPVA